jgi:hypothetical protein
METTNKERFMYALGGGVVLCAVGVVALLTFNPLPADNKDIVNIAIGSLLTMAGNVVGYFFGSSKGSSDKTALLGQNKLDETK